LTRSAEEKGGEGNGKPQQERRQAGASKVLFVLNFWERRTGGVPVWEILEVFESSKILGKGESNKKITKKTAERGKPDGTNLGRIRGSRESRNSLYPGKMFFAEHRNHSQRRIYASPAAYFYGCGRVFGNVPRSQMSR